MPTLSIITINLNNAAGLRKTIGSVICQTFTDYEYIIIDGGSTDGSVDVIKEYADRITYRVSEPDKGIYNAMNKGIQKATGDYLQFLNSGDCLVDNNVLDKVFSFPRASDIIYGNLIKLMSDGRRIKKIAPSENDVTMMFFFLGNTIKHPSSFISRNLFEKTFFDESYKIASDKKFFIENIIIHNCTIQSINLDIVLFDTTGITSSAESTSLTKTENETIMLQLLPERIYHDYVRFRALLKSPLYKHGPLIVHNSLLQKMIFKLILVLLNLSNKLSKGN